MQSSRIDTIRLPRAFLLILKVVNGGADSLASVILSKPMTLTSFGTDIFWIFKAANKFSAMESLAATKQSGRLVN